MKLAIPACLLIVLLIPPVVADIIVQTDGTMLDGRVVRQTGTEVVILPGGPTSQPERTISRTLVSRIIAVNEHGAAIRTPSTRPIGASLPSEPKAPPLATLKGSTYYIIPLHGIVGETILADSLAKSLSDAVDRAPTVVVLDIDSPGGLIDEAQKITKVLHRYNKQLRIVALADKDLSAAAIITLSCKEIYVKQTSMIGAAAAYKRTEAGGPEVIEEKMQSAWRAVARNSAEEGGHEPLLAEAMIDNSVELHLKTVDGKKVVAEGLGDRMLCRKGKLLTLTSHEAIECGLAAGDADDYAELGEILKLKGWKECHGLGVLLAEYTRKRLEVASAEMDKIVARFKADMAEARKADPSEGASLQRIVTMHQPTIMQPMIDPTPYQPGMPGVYQPGMPGVPQPGIPGVYQPGMPGVYQPGMPGVYQPGMPGVRQPGMVRPYVPPQPYIPQRRYVETPVGPSTVTSRTVAVVPPETKVRWHVRSLACVVAIQRAEQDLGDATSLCELLNAQPAVELFKAVSEDLAKVREEIYAGRYKYAGAADGTPQDSPQAGDGIPASFRPLTTTKEAIAQLTSRSASDQIAALRWLHHSAEPDARPEVVKASMPLLDSLDDVVRKEASVIVGRWAGKDDVPELIRRIKGLKKGGYAEQVAEHLLMAMFRLDVDALERCLTECRTNVTVARYGRPVLRGIVDRKDAHWQLAEKLLAILPVPPPLVPNMPDTLDEAIQQIGSRDVGKCSGGLCFLATAEVDAASRAQVVKAIVWVLDRGSSMRREGISALCHWATKEDLSELIRQTQAIKSNADRPLAEELLLTMFRLDATKVELFLKELTTDAECYSCVRRALTAISGRQDADREGAKRMLAALPPPPEPVAPPVTRTPPRTPTMPTTLPEALAGLGSPGVTTRERAFLWLATAEVDSANRPQVIKAVVQSLEQGSSVTRRMAIPALCHWAGKEELPELAHQLEGLKGPVDLRAAEALVLAMFRLDENRLEQFLQGVQTKSPVDEAMRRALRNIAAKQDSNRELAEKMLRILTDKESAAPRS